MPEVVTVDNDNGIILIDSSGLVGPEDLTQSLEKVLEIVEEHGLNKVLVDTLNLQQLPPTIKLFNFASELSKKALGLRHAVLFSETNMQIVQDLGFIETVALNRGTDMRAFISRDEALRWLKG